MDAADIKRARERAGLTSAQMAARLGVHLDTYRSWEAGRRNPKINVVAQIRALAAGEPLPGDEIAGLREVVGRLSSQVAELTAMVLRLDAEVARLSGR